MSMTFSWLCVKTLGSFWSLCFWIYISYKLIIIHVLLIVIAMLLLKYLRFCGASCNEPWVQGEGVGVFVWLAKKETDCVYVCVERGGGGGRERTLLICIPFCVKLVLECGCAVLTVTMRITSAEYWYNDNNNNYNNSNLLTSSLNWESGRPAQLGLGEEEERGENFQQHAPDFTASVLRTCKYRFPLCV